MRLPTMRGEYSREAAPAPVMNAETGPVSPDDQAKTPQSSSTTGREPGCEDLIWSQSLQPFP